MAITHFTPQLIGRSSGRSAVLAAAYRHCARMTHDNEGRTVDFTNKGNLGHEEFLLPADAPHWARALVADRSVAGTAEAFWNRVEAFEKREDAQFAKEFIIALPVELSKKQNIALMRQFVVEQVLARGQIADWVYHDEPGNPHVHLMTTLRPLTENGFGPKKIAVVGYDGQVLRTKTGKIQYRLWAGERQEFLEQRHGWLDLQNQHLALAGLEIRVDGRSYAERGIELEPTAHVGAGARAIQRKAEREGWSPSLERIEIAETRKLANAARILKRPEIVFELLTSEMSVFDERDVARVLHRYVDDAATFQALMARILQSPELLRLERSTVDFETGRRIPARYTTWEMIRLEAGMVNRAMWLSTKATHGVRDSVLEGVFDRHERLSDEQRTAIEHVTQVSRIAAVVGRAGAGKTTMMKAAREAWELAGYRVIGGTLAGKAAEGLQKEAGIESRTLASWELRWKDGRDALTDKTVMVIDEAGMVASKQMAYLLETAVRMGAKLVLIGDPEQLQPIEAGASFRAIVQRVGYAELERIYRQREAWMRAASLDLARGNIAKAIAAYGGHGRVIGEKLKAQAITSLIAAWDREYDPAKSALILAHLRRDVRELNRLAREKMVERGVVGAGQAFHTEDGMRAFDAGDRIVFLKNDIALGVKNGMLARVVVAAPGRIVTEVGEGADRRQVVVEQRLYRNIDHGYATTIHKSQGATVDRVKVLASLSLDRHLTYVAMTRHREDVTLYYGMRSFEKAGGLEHVLSRKNAKETTLDYERGTLYRQAIGFAENRGMHIVKVARTLVRDRIDWTLRQRQRLAGIAGRLRSVGARLGLLDTRQSQSLKEARPMVAGIKQFAKSVPDIIEEKLHADPAVKKQWEEVSTRFRYVFADPQTAFKAMNFDAVLSNSDTARQTLATLAGGPASFGPLKGGTGILSGKTQREERRVAEANVPALKREIERYLDIRQTAGEKIAAEEQTLRHRVSIDIPALSSDAYRVLERVRDAIDRNDLPAALGFAVSNREIKTEIDGFNKAVAERFGQRSLLANEAKSPSGKLFDKAAEGMALAEKHQLVEAWPVMRAAQQLAAHQRTAEALKQSETLRMAQRQNPVMKQ
ncbi:Ti-type conjugative transfer relaxase TraA [Chelatococcus asaccharovorans]|uniref:Ti-type conjugative transfer relaxase TraA n=1 Tax=Chelatococcus asaccharovorans TaxID=28210 RepID=UPI00224C750B|nr:Ti-type conjugative transfer relaxase TraA [Chelatococcus asaccharovorans]CAH1648055.1 Conjugal transfer protein TraA [Chelatococcus asaccharovorans]CAH1687155.1 Conjugal transfer protein TraA [Chelatococcus asaccharovorans]